MKREVELMKETIEYETPQASVRGVFLCENLAVSYVPNMNYGAVEYRPYDDRGTSNADIVLL
jgi:hypothetical protein